MSDEKTQLIRVGEQEVFLVLAERDGSDFTFYLRNDDDSLVNLFLRRASGEMDTADAQPRGAMQKGVAEGGAQTDAPGAPRDAEQAKAKSPSSKQNYSCRVHILKTLLDKKDLLVDANTGGEVVFLRKLLEFKNNKSGPDQYALLEQRLTKTFAGVSHDKLADKNLIKILIRELNNLLKSNELGELFASAGASEETETEKKILEQVKEGTAREKLSDYLKFCTLFGDCIKPLGSRVKVGRGLAGLSYEGKIWSLSFREQESGAGYDPDSSTDDNLNSIEELCSSLYEEIFHIVSQSETAAATTGTGEGEKRAADALQYGEKIKTHRESKLPEVSGLIVISGSTNSAKSLITRGLIHLYLENVNLHQPKRLPHLVTFEDPIEKYFANNEYQPEGAHPQLNVVMSAARQKIDYTPRQQEVDSGSLQDALRDALRQTPRVFFVGETRLKKDWQALVDFAATGHLVITTAHAGSLIEAMHKIFLALEAKTPAARNEVASRLLAVVHLKRTELEGYPFGVLVPALWRRVPRGLNALTAEGLASVLPHSHSDDDDPCSCLGRRYFVNLLIQLARGRPPAAGDGKFERMLTLQAIDWDLQGA